MKVCEASDCSVTFEPDRSNQRFHSRTCATRTYAREARAGEPRTKIHSSRDRCIVTFRHETGEVFTCEGLAEPRIRVRRKGEASGHKSGGIEDAKADALKQAERHRAGPWTVLSVSTPESIYRDLQRTSKAA